MPDGQGSGRLYFSISQLENIAANDYGGNWPPGGTSEVRNLIQTGRLTQIPTGPDGLPVLNRPPEPAIEGIDYQLA